MYTFVHAGLNFGLNQDPFIHVEKMIWIRNWYKDIDYHWLADRYIPCYTPRADFEGETK
jgi:serine/threonine protein phosphatase 1